MFTSLCSYLPASLSPSTVSHTRSNTFNRSEASNCISTTAQHYSEIKFSEYEDGIQILTFMGDPTPAHVVILPDEHNNTRVSRANAERCALIDETRSDGNDRQRHRSFSDLGSIRLGYGNCTPQRRFGTRGYLLIGKGDKVITEGKETEVYNEAVIWGDHSDWSFNGEGKRCLRLQS